MKNVYSLWICAFVSVLFLVCATPASATTMSVDDASSGYGTTVDLPIDVSSTSNIGAMDISLTYDPAVITATGVVANGTLISATDLIDSYTGTSGIVNISVASLSGITGTESIAIVQFSVVGSGGATSPLTLSTVDAYDLDNPTIVDGSVTGYAELTVTSTSGTFTATGEGGGLAMTGNIDGSGDIDMDDVVYLAKHYYGTTLFPDYGTISADGDIDGDGNIDMDDVVYLAKHYYGTTLFPDYGTLYPCT